MSPRSTRLDLATGTVVCRDCRVASTFFSRLCGLMGRRELRAGHGMLFPRTRSVHTHFMRFSIDVVFLDADNRIVSVLSGLRPWRTASSRCARSVLELRAGESERLGLAVGDALLEVD